MKNEKTKQLILEQLHKLPIIQVICERVGISRSTLYRWRDESPEFRSNLEEAIAEGEALINDMSESQLISLIKDKNYQAISFWLRRRHPKFKDRLEINASIHTVAEQLSPEQESVVRQALELAKFNSKNSDESKLIDTEQTYDTNKQSRN